MLVFCGLFGDRFRRLLEAVLAIEAFDATRGIDQPLRAGIKRMALRADLDVQFLGRRMRFESIATRTRHHAAPVVGMDSSFHLYFSVSFPGYVQPYHRDGSRTIIRGGAIITTRIPRRYRLAALFLFIFATSILSTIS